MPLTDILYPLSACAAIPVVFAAFVGFVLIVSALGEERDQAARAAELALRSAERLDEAEAEEAEITRELERIS